MTLHEFLALDHRFKWAGYGFNGRDVVLNDCFTFPASWVQRCTGVDVAKDFRGTYSSKEEAEAIIARHGGMVALAEHQLAIVHAKRVQSPQPGDVGIIEAPVGTGDTKHIGAICFGPVWAFLTPGRVIAKQTTFIAAWSF